LLAVQWYESAENREERREQLYFAGVHTPNPEGDRAKSLGGHGWRQAHVCLFVSFGRVILTGWPALLNLWGTVVGGNMKNPNLTETQREIVRVCEDIQALLISKNKKYGNSALEPVRVFSKSDTAEQICVRIDDKLSRISKGAGLLATDEDVINDLIGYLVLLKIAISTK